MTETDHVPLIVDYRGQRHAVKIGAGGIRLLQLSDDGVTVREIKMLSLGSASETTGISIRSLDLACASSLLDSVLIEPLGRFVNPESLLADR